MNTSGYKILNLGQFYCAGLDLFQKQYILECGKYASIIICNRDIVRNKGATVAISD